MPWTKIPKKKFDFYWLRDFYAILKIRLFWNLTTDLEKRQKTPFYSDNMFNEKSKHIQPYPQRLIMADF